MHYDVRYSQHGPNADTVAIEDIHKWLDGDQKKLDTLRQIAEHPEMTIDQLQFAFGMAGIQGFPVDAWARCYCPVKLGAWKEAVQPLQESTT